MVAKMQPAITDLYFKANPATDSDPRFYVDTARELSRVNRRLYSQTKLFGYQGLTFIWKAKNTATPPALTDLATIDKYSIFKVSARRLLPVWRLLDLVETQLWSLLAIRL